MEVEQNLKAAQATQKSWYDQVSRPRSFTLGLKILLLLPTTESGLLVKWQGPYVVQNSGAVTSKQHHQFHINLLKEWVSQEVVLFARRVEDEEEEQFFPTAQGPGGTREHVPPLCFSAGEAALHFPKGAVCRDPWTHTAGSSP